MQVSTAEFKKGLKIQLDGEPYSIVDFQHVKPGKGGAFVRTKLKHMKLGRVIDNTFRAGEKVELVDFDEKRMQYLYKDDRYHFMDLDTYDQISLAPEEVGEARHRFFFGGHAGVVHEQDIDARRARILVRRRNDIRDG